MTRKEFIACRTLVFKRTTFAAILFITMALLLLVAGALQSRFVPLEWKRPYLLSVAALMVLNVLTFMVIAWHQVQSARIKCPSCGVLLKGLDVRSAVEGGKCGFCGNAVFAPDVHA